jgi:hypothetical protein
VLARTFAEAEMQPAVRGIVTMRDESFETLKILFDFAPTQLSILFLQM